MERRNRCNTNNTERLARSDVAVCLIYILPAAGQTGSSVLERVLSVSLT